MSARIENPRLPEAFPRSQWGGDPSKEEGVGFVTISMDAPASLTPRSQRVWGTKHKGWMSERREGIGGIWTYHITTYAYIQSFMLCFPFCYLILSCLHVIYRNKMGRISLQRILSDGPTVGPSTPNIRWGIIRLVGCWTIFHMVNNHIPPAVVPPAIRNQYNYSYLAIYVYKYTYI